MKKRKLNEITKLGIILFLELIILILVHFKPSIDIVSVLKIPMSKEYHEPQIKAHFLNKDLTNKIRKQGEVNPKKAGVYKLEYSVKYLGIKSKKKVTVIIEDDIKPKLTLIGNSVIYLQNGDEYEELGYQAIDNNDGDITKKVNVKAKVNINKNGNYDITYQVTDRAGNQAETKRTIVVVSASDPNLKTIYLTFDDGPSQVTSRILDILKQEKIKATFFIVKKGFEYNDTIKRIYNEGHSLALHSSTHNYKYIYKSLDNYFSDLNDLQNYIKSITGTKTNIIRFPGGSSNTVSSFNPKIMTKLTQEVVKKGYTYFDWNIDSGDTGRIGKDAIIKNVTNNLGNYHTYVVLMHDYSLNDQTADALKEIIKYGKNNGYRFDKITKDTPIVHHNINN